MAPGQEVAGSTEWFKRLFSVVRADPAWGILLGLLFLDVLLAIVQGSVLGLVIDGVILWGIFTLQRWAYYVVIVITSLRILALVAVIALVAAGAPLAAGDGDQVISASLLAFLFIPLAISVFTFVVLVRRRQYFS